MTGVLATSETIVQTAAHSLAPEEHIQIKLELTSVHLVKKVKKRKLKFIVLFDLY